MVRTYSQEEELARLINEQEKELQKEEIGDVLDNVTDGEEITANAIQKIMDRSSTPGDDDIDEDLIM